MSIEMPDDILQRAADDPRRLLEETLCALWSQGKLSGGKAAQFLGLSRIEFWDLAGGRGYTWPYTAEDLREDVAALEKLGI